MTTPCTETGSCLPVHLQCMQLSSESQTRKLQLLKEQACLMHCNYTMIDTFRIATYVNVNLQKPRI